MITLLFVYFIAEKATNSPWGRVLRGIRDNENTMISSGKNVLRFKVKGFCFWSRNNGDWRSFIYSWKTIY
ncbi:MAG: hypothetical protein Ct9H90mP2_07050 [Dehalococcoidia bacterium]|nr:MAG: hypothetical protein Ct9H90mP2_07050 [Dehalococcoidia bacterium]